MSARKVLKENTSFTFATHKYDAAQDADRCSGERLHFFEGISHLEVDNLYTILNKFE